MPRTASLREQDGDTVTGTHITECALTRNHATSDGFSQDSEDDDVVATFPVYFVPALTAQTHVFQFPLRTLDRAYEMRDATLLCTRGAGALCATNDSSDSNCNSNTHVEIDMQRRAGEGIISAASRLTLHCTLDTFGSTSFASSDGSQGCGHNLLATATLPSAYVASKGLPMQCLPSSLPLTSSSHSTMYNYRLQAHPFSTRSDYLVGYVGSGGVHLTPVATVQQFAPLLRQHSEDVGEDDVHRGGGGNTATSSSNSIIGNKSGGRGTAAALVARVPLAFCSTQTTPLIAGLPGTDRIQRELLRCRSTMLNRDADTAYAMLFFASYTIESRAMRRRLVSITREQPRWSPSQPSSIAHEAKTRSGSNTEAVVDSLFPPEIVVSGGIAGGEEATEATILHRFAARHTIAQQVQQLMERCQVLPLETLVDYVVMPGDAAAADTTTTTAAMTKSSRRERAEAHVVNALRMCAMPMHGVWVSCSCNRFVGIAAALREVVLMRFYASADATVTRAGVNEVAPSSTLRRVVLDILRSVAVLQESAPTTTHARRRWRLRCVHHAASAAIEQQWQERYPATATLFRDAWVRRVQGIVTHVPHLLACHTPPRLFLLPCVSANSGSNSKRNNNNNSDNDSCMASCSALAMSSASSAQPMTTATMTTTATPVNTLSALHRDEQRVLPAVRAHIRALFAEYGVLNKQRAKELVLRGREIHYPDATNAMLATALQSCVRTFTPSTWVLQELGEPAVDRYRITILDIVRDLQTFTTRAVQMRLAATVCAPSDDANAEDSSGTVHSGDDVAPSNNASDNDNFTSTRSRSDAMMTRAVQRVLAEVADYKMAERLWHVKSGNVMQTLL